MQKCKLYCGVYNLQRCKNIWQEHHKSWGKEKAVNGIILLQGLFIYKKQYNIYSKKIVTRVKIISLEVSLKNTDKSYN
jgi:hypothetical protein